MPGFRLIEHFVQDFRYAVRTLRRNPGITAVAVLTLGPGTGANIDECTPISNENPLPASFSSILRSGFALGRSETCPTGESRMSSHFTDTAASADLGNAPCVASDSGAIFGRTAYPGTGLRQAPGGEPRDLIRMIFFEGLVLSAIGVAGGTVVAMGTGHIMSGR